MWNLKYHMSSHPGNHPCDFCNKQFLDADVLKLHMEFKHKNKLPTARTETDGRNYEEFINSPSPDVINDDLEIV